MKVIGGDLLVTAPSPDHFGEHFGAFFELLQRNPFVDGVGLRDVSGAKYDFVFEFGEHPAIGSIGDCFGRLTMSLFQALVDKMRFRIGEHSGPPVVYVQYDIEFFCGVSNLLK